MKNLSKIKGILCDIDGTLIFRGNPIPNAIETIIKLREREKRLLFLTNTDSRTPRAVFNSLLKLGFEIQEHEIFTPVIALKEYLKDNLEKKIYLVSTREVRKEFEEYHLIDDDNTQPDFVIISDFHDNWDVNRLNLAFKCISAGAKLIGTQGNKYYIDKSGNPVLDTGSFVQMLSFATGKPSEIFGKPSSSYLLKAIQKLSLKPQECIVIGDDINSDIQGAINAGIKGILVKTGKGKDRKPSNLKISPYLTVDSINSILDYL